MAEMDKAIAVLERFIVDFDNAHENNIRPMYDSAQPRSVREIEYRDQCIVHINFCIKLLRLAENLERRLARSVEAERAVMQRLGVEVANKCRAQQGLPCGYPAHVDISEFPEQPYVDPAA